MKPKLYRQGDVLLREVTNIPEAAQRSEPKERIILAYGEVTGHCHRIEELDKVDVFIGAKGEMYLRVKEAVEVIHEEHSAIALPAGNYLRVIQREYAPSEIRNVAD